MKNKLKKKGHTWLEVKKKDEFDYMAVFFFNSTKSKRNNVTVSHMSSSTCYIHNSIMCT